MQEISCQDRAGLYFSKNRNVNDYKNGDGYDAIVTVPVFCDDYLFQKD